MVYCNIKRWWRIRFIKGVTGYFEPGTVTALMGSSGAGKTTLLDVLGGRKNTVVIKGSIYVNGKLKDEHTFKHIIGYVEQFDTLSPHDTGKLFIFLLILYLYNNLIINYHFILL